MLPTPTTATELLETRKKYEATLGKLTAITKGIYFLKLVGVITPVDMEFLNAYTQSALPPHALSEEMKASSRRILESFLQRFSENLPEKSREELRKALENLAPRVVEDGPPPNL